MPERYSIEFLPSAARELAKIPREVYDRTALKRLFDRLDENP